MPTGTARTADDITESIRTLVDRLADAKLTQELARRGHDVAEEVGSFAEDVGSFADEAWRDSKPMRRDARKAAQRAIVDASKWSDRTWRKTVRPALKDLWKRRTVAMSAAGAAVPAAGAVIDDAAIRIGVKRERRHWGAFFLGLLVGAAVGAIAALLTAPKRGSEIRDELGSRAEELAAKAKDEWVPIFERATNGAGEILGEPAIEETAEDATATVQEAAADSGETVGDAGDQAASETAEAINDAFDAADRESPA